MESSLLNNFIGTYIGNVQGTAMNLGSLKKTGHVHVLEKGPYVNISCCSLLKDTISVSIERKKLEPFFDTKKKQMVTLDDGTMEERVSFIHSIDDKYGILDRWLGGLTSEMYAYQMKFRNGSLYAFRLQKYNTSDKSKIKYSIEISNIEKEYIPPTPLKTEEKPSAMKTDWDF